MRITIVNQYYAPDLSPTARLAASLAGHRAALGDEVTVVASSARYTQHSPVSGECPAGVTVHRVGGPSGCAKGVLGRLRQYASFFLRAAWRLARLRRQDVIVCLTTPPLVAWLGVLHRLTHPSGGTRLVQWNMDCYPEILEIAGLIKPGGMAARACRWLNRRLLRRLDHVVCLDQAMKSLLQSHYARGDKPSVTVVPNFESRHRFPAPGRAASWEGVRRLGLGGRLVVLYQGNAGWGHEFDAVLDAADDLRDEPVAFLFVGGGMQFPRIREAAGRRGLVNVHLHSYVPEEQVASVLASADLALITLSDEAAGVMSPSKLHGCLAMGLPVVYLGPPGSNVDDAVTRFGCGVRIPQGHAPELVRFLRSALSDRRQLATMKRAARQAFEEAYCEERTLPQLDEVIGITPSDEAARERRAA